jgi:predicted  nucleic acid-binding Zn-ribbon protein
VKLVETLAAIEALDLRHAELLSQQEQAAVRAKTDPTVRQMRQRRAGLEGLSQQQASSLRQLELEVAELRDRVKTHEKAIYDGSVRHPADLQRRQHELQTLAGKIGEFEETELAQMEAQEQTTQELRAVTSELAEREREVEQQRVADRGNASNLAEELGAVDEERRQLAEGLAPSVLRIYERTAARRRPAIAKVVGGTCSGCRLPLAPRLLQEARQDHLVTCENCERILLI